MGVLRGQGRHEPQRYAQQQHRMQPYPMNQQGGYADAKLGHGPGAPSRDSGVKLSPGGGLLTRAWRAVAVVMGSQVHPEQLPHTKVRMPQMPGIGGCVAQQR